MRDLGDLLRKGKLETNMQRMQFIRLGSRSALEKLQHGLREAKIGHCIKCRSFESLLDAPTKQSAVDVGAFSLGLLLIFRASVC
jgi:hypothetical protein